jgi:DNA end-binding protein Ku
MPRPSWSGFLRLSLVSCPITLSPATSEAERIRFNMLNPATGNRIAMQTVDSETRDPVERSETVKGYKLDDGRYVTVTDEELADLKPESSKVLTLNSFVSRDEVDPLYVDTAYFVYPEKTGTEAYRVIAQALRNKKRVALGRIVLSQREHPVMLEPFEDGLLMCTLRSEDEVRSADFDLDKTPLDKEMVSLAESIVEKMKGTWNPEKFNDTYQDAVRELIETKAKGLPVPKGTPLTPPSNVVDLMAVLKKSLAATEPDILSTKRQRPTAHEEGKVARRKKVRAY